MINIGRRVFMVLIPMWLMLASHINANEVAVVGADFRQDANGSWTVSVGLEHADTGWDHYADIWRVVDVEGNVLGERVLLHPHEDEQPFTRQTSGVAIPEDTQTLYIEAHDSVHGWTPHRLKIDMTQVVDGMLRVKGTTSEGR